MYSPASTSAPLHNAGELGIEKVSGVRSDIVANSTGFFGAIGDGGGQLTSFGRKKCFANQLSTWKNANDQKKTLPLFPQVFTSSNLSKEGLKSGPALTADSIQYQFGTA